MFNFIINFKRIRLSCLWEILPRQREGNIRIFPFIRGKSSLIHKFRYKCDNVYNKSSEGGMRYDAPEVAVGWGTLLNGIEPVLSEKDKIGPNLTDSDNQFVYGVNC